MAELNKSLKIGMVLTCLNVVLAVVAMAIPYWWCTDDDNYGVFRACITLFGVKVCGNYPIAVLGSIALIIAVSKGSDLGDGSPGAAFYLEIVAIVGALVVCYFLNRYKNDMKSSTSQSVDTESGNGGTGHIAIAEVK